MKFRFQIILAAVAALTACEDEEGNKNPNGSRLDTEPDTETDVGTDVGTDIETGTDGDTDADTDTDADADADSDVDADTDSDTDADTVVDTGIDTNPKLTCDSEGEYCASDLKQQVSCEDYGGKLLGQLDCLVGLCCKQPPLCPVEKSGFACMANSLNAWQDCGIAGGQAPEIPNFRCEGDNFCCGGMDL